MIFWIYYKIDYSYLDVAIDSWRQPIMKDHQTNQKLKFSIPNHI